MLERASPEPSTSPVALKSPLASDKQMFSIQATSGVPAGTDLLVVWLQECISLGRQGSVRSSMQLQGRAGMPLALLCALHFLKVTHRRLIRHRVWRSLLPHVKRVLGSLQPDEQ